MSLVPNVVAIIGFIALLTALELQGRIVEEPYLQRVHGARYQHYAERVGRLFLGSAGRDHGSSRTAAEL